jgi:hypothetical protein
MSEMAVRGEAGSGAEPSGEMSEMAVRGEAGSGAEPSGEMSEMVRGLRGMSEARCR